MDLGDGRTVTLYELRPKDIRTFLTEFPQDLEKVDIKTLLTSHMPAILGLLEGECIIPPKGESLEELSLSEIATVWASYKEMHADFFGLAGSLASLVTPPESLPETASS